MLKTRLSSSPALINNDVVLNITGVAMATKKSSKKSAKKTKTSAKKVSRKTAAKKTGAKKTVAKKTSKRTRSSSKRELISPRSDKRYVRRDAQGQFSESDDQGKSLGADVRVKAKTKVKSGQGDKGDR
jgi:uncharacterized membrane protein